MVISRRWTADTYALWQHTLVSYQCSHQWCSQRWNNTLMNIITLCGLVSLATHTAQACPVVKYTSKKNVISTLWLGLADIPKYSAITWIAHTDVHTHDTKASHVLPKWHMLSPLPLSTGSTFIDKWQSVYRHVDHMKGICGKSFK